MKRISALLAIGVLLTGACLAAVPKKPKLILTIVIDQFRYVCLTRFRTEYTAGLDRLLTKGAWIARSSTAASKASGSSAGLPRLQLPHPTPYTPLPH